MKLKKREKILLQVLAMVAICALMVVYWILPQYEALRTNRKTLENLEIQKIETERIIAGAQIARAEIVSLQEQAETLYRLMGQTQSYDVSLLLSGMLDKHNLLPLALDISAYKRPQTPEAEQPTKETTRQEIRYPQLDEIEGTVQAQEAQTNEPAVETEEERQLMSAFVLMRTVTLSFSGTREDADSFLDEITNYNPSVVVEGYTVQTYETTQTYELRLTIYEFVEPGIVGELSSSGVAVEDQKEGA